MYETTSARRAERTYLPPASVISKPGGPPGAGGRGPSPQTPLQSGCGQCSRKHTLERSRGGQEFSDSLSRAEKQDVGQDESHWPPGFALPGGLSLRKGQVSVAQESDSTSRLSHPPAG